MSSTYNTSVDYGVELLLGWMLTISMQDIQMQRTFLKFQMNVQVKKLYEVMNLAQSSNTLQNKQVANKRKTGSLVYGRALYSGHNFSK
jgi:hypothetical protein